VSLEVNHYYLAGKLGAPHGIKGAFRVQSYLENPIDLSLHKVWFIPAASVPKLPICIHPYLHAPVNGVDPDHNFQKLSLNPIEFAPMKPQGSRFVTALPGILDRDQAQLLCNIPLYLPINQLPELDAGSYYWRDLIGLSVFDTHDTHQGQVIDLMETGANDVLVMKTTDGRRVLIPYIPDQVIIHIDLQGKRITVGWDFEEDSSD